MKKYPVEHDPLFAQILDINCNNCPVEDGDPNNGIRRINALGNSPQLEALKNRALVHPFESKPIELTIEKCQYCLSTGKPFENSITVTRSCLWRGRI